MGYYAAVPIPVPITPRVPDISCAIHLFPQLIRPLGLKVRSHFTLYLPFAGSSFKVLLVILDSPQSETIHMLASISSSVHPVSIRSQLHTFSSPACQILCRSQRALGFEWIEFGTSSTSLRGKWPVIFAKYRPSSNLLFSVQFWIL